MKRPKILRIGRSLACACALLGASASVRANQFSLAEHGLNIDGTIYDNPSFPGIVNASGFDFGSGLGSIVVQVQGPGTHFIGFYADLEIDETENTFFNEFGVAVGAPPAGQAWEIDEPGWTYGDIFINFQGSSLDNANGVPPSLPDDVSMALGWNFLLASDEVGTILFNLGSTQPASGFYLQQHDPDSNADVFFSSSLNIRPSLTGLPDGGPTALLLLGSLAMLALYQKRQWAIIVLTALSLSVVAKLQAAPPVVKTVPWAAAKPLVPHDSWSGKEITLKGVSDVQGPNILYTWDFGDGSPVASGTVTDRYAIEAKHTYTGAVGTTFTARLTVQNNSTGESSSNTYYITLHDVSTPEALLKIRVNVAIDDGLWYLHKSMRRYDSGGTPFGDWSGTAGYGGYASLGFYSVTAVNINAFEVNGHLENGNMENPYTETVQRGMRFLFSVLTYLQIDQETNGLGTFNPDSNNNGIGIVVNQSYPYYQTGMIIDAIVASGTPTAIASTGPANIIGRTYKNIVQDMVDAYAWAQYDGSVGGGWRYDANQAPDNSACQWAAIGLIAAERNWNCTIPPLVKEWNKVWLAFSQHPIGYFGYTDSNPAGGWGPFATTPSGMVQMAMDGIGRGTPSWDKAETYMRDNFGNGGGPSAAIKDYYYGLFSFVKSMLLHNVNGINLPITLLKSATPGVTPLDWYGAQMAKGDPTDGVARTLVDDQSVNSSPVSGYWWGHNVEGNQYRFETAQAIIMLQRTLFESGAPVAVAKATPNPAVAGQLVSLTGAASYHQDPSHIIDSWEWDVDNDGVFDSSGPTLQVSFTSVGTYPITLRVSDNSSPEKFASAILNVLVSTPPLPPSANAGGSYSFCPTTAPWFLQGSGSINPDEGQSEPGMPPDTIISYEWDLDGDGNYDDAFGPQPDVTGYFGGLGPGSYLIQLRVTDRTSVAFPSSSFGNLSDTDSAYVVIRDTGDVGCACVSDLAARVKSGKVQLTWTPSGAPYYNVYRSTLAGGPYIYITSTASNYSTYLDSTVVNGTTYYYVVRETNLAGEETCQSNEARATPRSR